MFSFIETRLFTKLVLECLGDEEYGAAVAVLPTLADYRKRSRAA